MRNLNNKEKLQLKRLEKIKEINCNGQEALKNIEKQILTFKQ